MNSNHHLLRDVRDRRVGDSPMFHEGGLSFFLRVILSQAHSLLSPSSVTEHILPGSVISTVLSAGLLSTVQCNSILWCPSVATLSAGTALVVYLRSQKPPPPFHPYATTHRSPFKWDSLTY